MTEKEPQARGARPAGALDEAGAGLAVRDLFNRIAPRYDALNHLLSCNIDRFWWWRAARAFRAVLARADAQVVDICCGTGDMTRALLRLRPAGALPVLAGDFAHAMLLRGAAKLRSRAVLFFEADALHLPLADGSADLLTTAFGFRNLANYELGLREFHRVLKPGAELGILDFSQPRGPLGKGYAIYFHRVLPVLGSLLSGSRAAYNYLPSSVESFPAPEEMLKNLQAAGFAKVSWTPYTFGIAGLYRGVKQ